MQSRLNIGQFRHFNLFTTFLYCKGHLFQGIRLYCVNINIHLFLGNITVPFDM